MQKRNYVNVKTRKSACKNKYSISTDILINKQTISADNQYGTNILCIPNVD